MRHLLTLDNLAHERFIALLDRADALRETQHLHGNLLQGCTVMNLFFEASTRTRISFELAARRLGAHMLNFDTAGASIRKGESMLDTLRTLEAMTIDALIVRHAENGTPAYLAEHVQSDIAVINGGDGDHAHPTQGLLDALTVRRHCPDPSKLSVVICGDIRHSRVARSDVHALSALGVGEIRLCAPPYLAPAAATFPDCSLHDDFDQAIEGADVVIMLRLQTERMGGKEIPDTETYFQRYGLDARRLARAHETCLVMHPGPINRGVEIAGEIADGAQSLIREQVANGVLIRMAVLAELLGR